MPIGIKHDGMRKRKNPDYPAAAFAIWMCEYCDESLMGHDYVSYSPKTDKGSAYHLVCFDVMRGK